MGVEGVKRARDSVSEGGFRISVAVDIVGRVEIRKPVVVKVRAKREA